MHMGHVDGRRAQGGGPDRKGNVRARQQGKRSWNRFHGIVRESSIADARRVPRATFVVVALSALLAVAIPAGAASAGASGQRASLRPPVITEQFKPVLPCKPSTTVGQEGCGERRVLAGDARLNADFKVIFALLPAGLARRAFVASENAWLTYRNAGCKSLSEVYQGGTVQPVVYVNCLSTRNAFGHQELVSFYKTLTQGRAKAPKLP